ncbi:hypothetical protein AXG93_4620s1310 [Marchantia polymorpha subsp. ruderalis]|uniref:Uncharacterized protein n=1 Tax=Marchantia polymorpha subsp. ruderalis TaxID=1480154 RepID=A0A176VX31_MARPO|nr:hypothetical protein AXG93_4620s1310 [Marchantia polymorpha subsp. ruderalis]
MKTGPTGRERAVGSAQNSSVSVLLLLLLREPGWAGLQLLVPIYSDSGLGRAQFRYSCLAGRTSHEAEEQASKQARKEGREGKGGSRSRARDEAKGGKEGKKEGGGRMVDPLFLCRCKRWLAEVPSPSSLSDLLSSSPGLGISIGNGNGNGAGPRRSRSVGQIRSRRGRWLLFWL